MNSKSLLYQTGSGSVPVQVPPSPGSLRHTVSLSVQGSTAGESSPMISLHMDLRNRSIRRCSSESNIDRSEIRTISKLRSRSFSMPRIPELEYAESRSFAENLPANKVSWEELGSPGGGMSKNGNSGGGGNSGNGSDAYRHNIGAYYQEMIKSNPTNSLLLRNYARYLHEVEGDAVKAEEYYGRAILASPGDGEVLSLYGKLIWETQRDETRAKSYFTQAIQASPHDCMVLGSYAHFLWEAEEEQHEEGKEEIEGPGVAVMMEVF